MSLDLSPFQTLASFSFPAGTQASPGLPIPLSSFTIQRNTGGSLVAKADHFVPDSSKLESLSLRGDPCPSCRGRKYGFTAYFHNLKIFPEPPHEILPLVEEAYILRDRLKSLLVTYTMRDVEHSEMESMMAHIHHWDFSVGALTDEVMNSASNAGFVLNLGRLDDVRRWQISMVDELKYYASCQTQMKLPKGRLAVLMVEYRRVWEAVWVGYVYDRKMMQSELDGIGYPVCM